MEKRHRIFIAINLPGDIKKQLAKYYDKWPELPAKWTAKDNLHITLEFLEDLTDMEIADVCKVVTEVSQKTKSFSINLNKILYGPLLRQGFEGRAPKFVWVMGERSEELSELKENLQEKLLEKIRFKPASTQGGPEGKAFVPHITLARISEWEFKKFDLDERPEIAEDIDLSFSVETIEVMESELKRGGPVYTILESHELQS